MNLLSDQKDVLWLIGTCLSVLDTIFTGSFNNMTSASLTTGDRLECIFLAAKYNISNFSFYYKTQR